MNKKMMEAFNISLLYLTPKNLAGLGEIKSLELYNNKGEYHEEGLYSFKYFGQLGHHSRRKRLAYIDLGLEVIHPLVFNVLRRMRRLYAEIIASKTYAIWNDEIKDFEKSDALSGDTGYYFFIKHFHEIDFEERDSTQRTEGIKLIYDNKDKILFNKLIVIPAGLRDLYKNKKGMDESDEINEIYRRILSTTNTLTFQTINLNPQLFDKPRYQLQLLINELYEYIEQIISGKKKLINGKWMSRRIQHGTRNVLSASIPRTKQLGVKSNLSVNNTQVGILQFLIGIGQVGKYKLKNGILSEVFIGSDAPARLINKKTLEQEEINVTNQTYDYWMSNEGLDKVINSFRIVEKRHEYVEIEDHYLALIYKGDDMTFKVFYDIRELPDGFDKRKVTPITLAELFYLSLYEDASEYPGLVTRYPVSSANSTYPSFSYLMTTTELESRVPLNENWEKDDTLPMAPAFPIKGSQFFDTTSVSNPKLSGLDGDNM